MEAAWIRKLLKKYVKGGFGLNNVAQRLRMYYGDQAEILVESEKGIGTCFKIFLNKKT